MTCKECFNWNGKDCDTMTAPFNDLSCFMDKGERISAEERMMDYALTYGSRDSVSQLRKTMKKLKER